LVKAIRDSTDGVVGPGWDHERVTATEKQERAKQDASGGFSGLLPPRMLRWRRPVWWQELIMIAAGYWAYTKTRNTIPDSESIALRHGWSLQHLQDRLHLNFELSFNHFIARNEWLAQGMDYYYATIHFIITIAVMVWLFLRRPHLYRGARTVLITTTLIGLLFFWLYPTAPPRLLPGIGYVDTLIKFHTWGSLADPKVAEHSNQYAAMPSLHTAWALWCGVTIFFCARRMWLRVLGLLYPLFTVTVIIATANHFILDAVGGAVVLAAGYGFQRLLSGHGAYSPPFDAPDFLVGEAGPAAAESHGIASSGP